jgi:hypothetical protein
MAIVLIIATREFSAEWLFEAIGGSYDNPEDRPIFAIEFIVGTRLFGMFGGLIVVLDGTLSKSSTYVIAGSIIILASLLTLPSF